MNSAGFLNAFGEGTILLLFLGIILPLAALVVIIIAAVVALRGHKKKVSRSRPRFGFIIGSVVVFLGLLVLIVAATFLGPAIQLLHSGTVTIGH